MVLVDTSVWVDHLRKGDQTLQQLLEEGEVASHPFVIGEPACGHIRNREEILKLLDALPSTAVSDDREVLMFIESQRLHGQGMGYIDGCLLSSCLMDHLRLWTRDGRLARAARKLNVAFKA